MNFVFAIWGLSKLALDSIVVVRLTTAGFVPQAICLLIGMISAYTIHWYCERRLLSLNSTRKVDSKTRDPVAGKVDILHWAPFFMDPDSYYESFSETKKNRLLFLFAITFKEASAFLLEDGAFIAVYGNEGVQSSLLDSTSTIDSLSASDQTLETIDTINVWITFIRSVLSVSILVAAFVATWNISWCRRQRDIQKQQQEIDNSWYSWFQKNVLWASTDQPKEQMSKRQLTLLVIHNTIKVVTFLIFWIFAFTLLGFNISAILCFTDPNAECDSSTQGANEWTMLSINWMVGLYFAYLLLPRWEVGFNLLTVCTNRNTNQQRKIMFWFSAQGRPTERLSTSFCTAPLSQTISTVTDNTEKTISRSLQEIPTLMLQESYSSILSLKDDMADASNKTEGMMKMYSKSPVSSSSSSVGACSRSTGAARRVDFVGAVLPIFYVRSKSGGGDEHTGRNDDDQLASAQFCGADFCGLGV